MQLNLGLPCSVFPEKCVSLYQLNVILLRHPDIEDTLRSLSSLAHVNKTITFHSVFFTHLIVSAGPLGLLYDGRKCVREVFEQEVLLLHVHA